ncbi:MAG: sigma-54-dependent Fis family transcriptional regulator [Candidatus Cloacimonetes bacterium]|jgi:DNA-binding NtrC family response regulator|nr:sigma-54-dependent Fis family transcriptional regulator [Candidatus Cloacimonadota bacterium]HPN40264.1 sigma-54 dependent transcriptional regulator [Candidatus Cloacimonadota bacterium]
MKGKVIILEDDVVLAEQISKVLKRFDYSVMHATNSDTFFEELRSFAPDVILLDVFLVGSRLNGIQVLKYLKENLDLNYKIIVISGEVTSSQITQIRDLGAYHFIEKGSNFSANQLLLHIDNAITLKRQEEEHIGLQIEYISLKKQYTRRFPFIGESEAIRKVREQLSKLADVDEDVFLIGETGTGKEVAANYFYINSQRFGKAFHTVNCSALTESLIESELFGHVKGAFTSADRNNTGFFEECSEGVLFLDEVTNLSLPAQAKILRAIENKEIQVVGGPLKKVNTRLIFASNASIDVLADPQRFRPDLFYRIEGSVVEIPPLRKRGDDILLLISYFFTNYASRFNISDKLDLNELRGILLSYDWPGNVRELQNFCKSITIKEPEITNKVILQQLRNKISQQRNGGNTGMEKFLTIPSIRESTAAFEREYLIHYLDENAWQVSKTAAAIGIERTTLYKKMKQLGIVPIEES